MLIRRFNFSLIQTEFCTWDNLAPSLHFRANKELGSSMARIEFHIYLASSLHFGLIRKVPLFNDSDNVPYLELFSLKSSIWANKEVLLFDSSDRVLYLE